MAAIELERLSKVYADGTRAVNDFDLEVADGELVVFVGPSGCGKTSALRMIAGLEEITSGTIRVGGRVVNDLPPKNRDMAMVFQNYALYPHMNVYDNMGFGLKMRGLPKDEIRRRVTDAARVLGLTEVLRKRPRHLSGGQRQRVAMGRAIVRDPKVFLFDEPLSNLDAKLRVAMRSEIKALHQRLKTTTVYVTHDQVEAMTMADRIAVMNEGRIEQLGEPLELYDRPTNLFVAQFIGSPAMNVFEGVLRDGAVEALGARWPVPQGTRAPAGRAVKYGIRPVHFDLNSEGIPAEVVVVEPMGAETELVLKIGGESLTVMTHGRSNAAPGERIKVAPNAQHAHVFDASSGERL